MSDARFDLRLAGEWEAATRRVPVPSIDRVLAAADSARASRRAIVAEIEEIRRLAEGLHVALEAGGQDRLATPRWTVRDVVAHLASWAWRTRVEAEALLAETTLEEVIPFGTDGPHAWNERALDGRRGRSLRELFAEMDQEHERLTGAVIGAADADVVREVDLPRTIGEPPAPWRRTIGAMILMSCWHARLHLARLERILEP